MLYSPAQVDELRAYPASQLLLGQDGGVSAGMYSAVDKL